MFFAHKSLSRFAAFLLLAAAVILPTTSALSSYVPHMPSAGGQTVLTAEGTCPTPPPTPIKQA